MKIRIVHTLCDAQCQKYIIQTIIADKTTTKCFNDVISKFQIFPPC